MAELARQQRDRDPKKRLAAVPLVASGHGHPSVEQLMAEQGTGPVSDVSLIHGNFWPEEESVEEFVATVREWRGHKRTDPSA